MKLLKATLPATLTDILKVKPGIAIAMDLADYATKRWYLVGGTIYRALIQISHGIDAGLNDCDFDFLVEKEYKQNWRANLRIAHPGFWQRKIKDQVYDDTGRVSYKYTHKNENRKYSVDVIGPAWNKKRPDAIEYYFEEVPLHIQQCAFDPIENAIIASDECLSNINTKTVTWNKMHSYHGEDYLDKKQASLFGQVPEEYFY